jgi:hypothetical protein
VKTVMATKPSARDPNPPRPTAIELAMCRALTALSVRFTMEPTSMGPATVAVLDDTCGNLIQIVQV